MMVTNLLEQSAAQTPLASSGGEQQRGSKTCSKVCFLLYLWLSLWHSQTDVLSHSWAQVIFYRCCPQMKSCSWQHLKAQPPQRTSLSPAAFTKVLTTPRPASVLSQFQPAAVRSWRGLFGGQVIRRVPNAARSNQHQVFGSAYLCPQVVAGRAPCVQQTCPDPLLSPPGELRSPR